MTDIGWSNVKRTLGDLKPWASNPRFSTKKQARALLRSWDELGQFQTIAISPTDDVYDGHQRLSALLTVHGAGYEIDARQSSRHLTDDERKRLVIAAHVGAVGSWDWDKLASWDTPALKDWGMDADALKAWQTDAGQLAAMLVCVVEPEDAFGALPSEDRAPFQQMTFTLHDDQAAIVRAALRSSIALGPFVDSQNENSNGNALARICEMFCNDNC